METRRLEIELRGSSLVCDILVRRGLLGHIRSTLKDLSDASSPGSIAIITDSNTARLFGSKVRNDLLSVSERVHLFSFEAGEKSKTLATVETLAAGMDAKRIDRSSAIIAIGGGVVGDVSGFLASIYKRGIPYAQVPTTLLAQVDSSIGGKTGVDGAWGKNQLGTFYQPRSVLIDPDSLDTLPKKEFINGLAEIVKSAIIADREMFYELSTTDLFDINQVKKFIYRTCAIKARVVAQDERERNLRSILNYGHTLGHAVEAESHYELNHGTSVVLGMIAEGWIAEQLGLLKEKEYNSQLQVFQSMLADGSFDHSKVVRVLRSKKTLVRLAYSDKKSTRGKIRMSLPKRIGSMASLNGEYRIAVSAELFEDAISHLVNTLSSLSN